MLGAFQHQQIPKSMPNGPKTIPSSSETLSVSSSSSPSLFHRNSFHKLIFPHSCWLLQCSYTHQVKIQWSKWRNNPTTLVTSKIQSCTWTMATHCSTSLSLGGISSPVGSLVTVKRSRSCTSLCFQATALQHLLLLTVPLHYRTLHRHRLTRLSSATSLNRLLHRRH